MKSHMLETHNIQRMGQQNREMFKRESIAKKNYDERGAPQVNLDYFAEVRAAEQRQLVEQNMRRLDAVIQYQNQGTQIPEKPEPPVIVSFTPYYSSFSFN